MCKKIGIINSVYNQGSTGRICFELALFLQKNGIDAKTYYGRNKNESNGGVFFGSHIDNFVHAAKSRITDKQGFYSKSKTRILIKKLEEFKPDLLILNNLHGYYLNIEILLEWIKENNIKVISVFHDCWNFTGHCAHFSLVNCNKWQKGCHDCECKRDYPKSIFLDNSQRNYETKKSFTSA